MPTQPDDLDRELQLAERLRPEEKRQPSPAFRAALRLALVEGRPLATNRPSGPRPLARLARQPAPVLLVALLALVLAVGSAVSLGRGRRSPQLPARLAPSLTTAPSPEERPAGEGERSARATAAGASLDARPVDAPNPMPHRPLGLPSAATSPQAPSGLQASPAASPAGALLDPGAHSPATGVDRAAEPARASAPARPQQPSVVPVTSSPSLPTPSPEVTPSSGTDEPPATATAEPSATPGLPATSTPEPTSTGRPTTTPRPQPTDAAGESVGPRLRQGSPTGGAPRP